MSEISLDTGSEKKQRMVSGTPGPWPPVVFTYSASVFVACSALCENKNFYEKIQKHDVNS